MKTNPLISRLHNRPGTQASSPAKIRLRWLFFFLLSLIAVLISLVACKSPATLTNDTQHHTRDSNYHATVHRIETHDTIIFGAPYIQSMVRPGDRTSLKAGEDACVPGLLFNLDISGFVFILGYG